MCLFTLETLVLITVWVIPLLLRNLIIGSEPSHNSSTKLVIYICVKLYIIHQLNSALIRPTHSHNISYFFIFLIIAVICGNHDLEVERILRRREEGNNQAILKNAIMLHGIETSSYVVTTDSGEKISIFGAPWFVCCIFFIHTYYNRRSWFI